MAVLGVMAAEMVEEGDWGDEREWVGGVTMNSSSGRGWRGGRYTAGSAASVSRHCWSRKKRDARRSSSTTDLWEEFFGMF